MNTTTRTDIHRPAEFNPEDYVYVGSYDNNGPNEGIVNRETGELTEWWRNTMKPALKSLHDAGNAGRIAYGNGAQCDHCGARIRYVGLFRHVPTGDVIAVGETCADGRMEYSKADFDRLRKDAQLDRAAQRILKAWTQFKAERPEVEWDILAESTNEFIADVLRRGRNSGTLSERQVEAIVEAHARDKQRAEEQAQREANALPPVAVPTGNGITIEGKVLATKWVENDFGRTLKMLVEVETDAGAYKVYGTVPSSLNCERDDLVRFVANVERSDDDQSFGFFKRPRKAEILEGSEA